MTRLHQLARVQLVVRASRGEDLRLLLQREVSVGEGRVDVLLVQVQNLVVRDGARVGEVVHAATVVQHHLDADGQQVVQHGHGVGDVHHALVLGDLRHKVARRQVVQNGHAHAENQRVRIHLLQLEMNIGERIHLLRHCLGVAVEAVRRMLAVLPEAESGNFSSILTLDETPIQLENESDKGWYRTDKPKPRMETQSLRKKKFTLTVVWGACGIVCVKGLERPKTVNTEYFCNEILTTCKEWYERRRRRQGVGSFLFHMDNA